MTERSRSRHNERSTRIKTSRNQYSPEGSRDIVCIEKVDSSSESEYSSESEFQHPPTRNVSCQTRTKFVIQSKPKQKKEYPIRYVVKEESPERDYPQKYVIQRSSTRNVRCQMTTHYFIPGQYRKRKTSNKKIQVVVDIYPDTPSPRTQLSDNIDVTVHYDKDYDSLYPKSPKDSRKLVHYIDLRQPANKLKQKPIEEFGRDIIYQLKKEGYIYDKVTDTRHNSMENPIVMVDGHRYDKVTDDLESITIKSTTGKKGQQSNDSNLSKEQKKNVINQTIVYDYR
ncbi:uncharacterized protein LOC134686186 [Mytilus trossulus]|uniref:uncharacterized protein LOC134686186 n=1 Tax=Mytilus trossulus TaxID=6551 RepID=UPI003005D051